MGAGGPATVGGVIVDRGVILCRLRVIYCLKYTPYEAKILFDGCREELGLAIPRVGLLQVVCVVMH